MNNLVKCSDENIASLMLQRLRLNSLIVTDFLDRDWSSERTGATMNLILAMGFGGPYEIAIVGGVIILLFGGAKVAQFGKSMGLGIREFKAATRDEVEPALANKEIPLTGKDPLSTSIAVRDMDAKGAEDHAGKL